MEIWYNEGTTWGRFFMYRLVIADDEFYIREGLCKLDWAAMGIEVAAA